MPKMGKDGRTIRDALFVQLRAEGQGLQEIGGHPEVQLSAMSVSRVLAAAAEAERRSAEPSSMVYHPRGERPITVDFTSKLVQWRMRRPGGGYDDDPELCAAFWRWRADRLAGVPDAPPPLDPSAGVDRAEFAGAAVAVGVSVRELMARLWRADTAPSLGRDDTVLAAAVDGGLWTTEEWAAVQAYRRWLGTQIDQWLSADFSAL